MRAAARDVGVPVEHMTIISVPHDRVPAYLAAGDGGLLLRERSLINEVASPVKFGEYLASGTPVIISDGIGDYSALTRRERVGLVLNSKWQDDIITARLQEFVVDYIGATTEWRSRCRQSAHQFLNLSQYVPKMAEVYRQLSGQLSRSRTETALIC